MVPRMESKVIFRVRRLALFAGCLALCGFTLHPAAFGRTVLPAHSSAQDQSASSPKEQNNTDSQSGTDQSDDANQSPKADSDQNADQPGSKTAPNAKVKLRIEVANDVGKPIPNASVYVRFNEAGGFLHHDHLAELDLKTNQDGSVKVPEVPQGKIMIQVIATGW